MSDSEFSRGVPFTPRAKFPDPSDMDPSAGPVRAPSSQPSALLADLDAAERHQLQDIIYEQQRQIDFWRDQCSAARSLLAKAMKALKDGPAP